MFGISDICIIIYENKRDNQCVAILLNDVWYNGVVDFGYESSKIILV